MLTLTENLKKLETEQNEAAIRVMLLKRLVNTSEDHLDQAEKTVAATWIAELRGDIHRLDGMIREVRANLDEQQPDPEPLPEKSVLRRATSNPEGIVEPGDLWVHVSYTDKPDADGFYHWRVTVARVVSAEYRGHFTFISAFDPVRIEARSGRNRNRSKIIKIAHEEASVLHERYFVGMNRKRADFMAQSSE